MTEPAEEQPDPKPNDGSTLLWQSPPVPPEVLPSPFGEDTE